MGEAQSQEALVGSPVPRTEAFFIKTEGLHSADVSGQDPPQVVSLSSPQQKHPIQEL